MPTYDVTIPVEYPTNSGIQLTAQAKITAPTPEAAIGTLAQSPQVRAGTADISGATADELPNGA